MTFSGNPTFRPPARVRRDGPPRHVATAKRGAFALARAGEHSRQRDLRAPARRPSRILRDLLTQNPNVRHFTVRRIVSSIEQHGPAASLMLFSLPAIVPVPGTLDLVGAPTMAMSSVLLSGRQKVVLPPSLLERSIPRRALALAIHAVLPILERAEKMTRKRWSWLCTPAAQRAIGVLVFLLALPLAFPVLGFGLPHATSLFTIALGMLEQDGVTIALGVTAGIASLIFFTAKSFNPQALSKAAVDWFKRFVHQLTSVRATAAALLKRAWQWLSVKLLSGPSKRAKNAGKRAAVCITSNVRQLALTPLNGFATEARLRSMAVL